MGSESLMWADPTPPEGWVRPETQSPSLAEPPKPSWGSGTSHLEQALSDYEAAIVIRDPEGGEQMTPRQRGTQWESRCPRWRICGSSDDSFSIAEWGGKIRYFCRRCAEAQIEPSVGDYVRYQTHLEAVRREQDHLGHLSARERIAAIRIDLGASGSPLADHPGLIARISDPEPGSVMLATPSGAPLIVKDSVNLWWGAPGRGKSWAAMWAVSQVLQDASGPSWVIWCSWEQPLPTIRDRALAVGVDAGANLVALSHPDMAETASLIRRTPPHERALVVIDSVEASGCPADTGSIHEWKQTHVDPLIEAGATLLLIDHIAKGQDNAIYPRGSLAKMAMIQGAAIRLLSGSRMWTRLTSGSVTMRLEKDNTGAELGDIAVLRAKPTAQGLAFTLDDSELSSSEQIKRALAEIVSQEPTIGRRKAEQLLTARGCVVPGHSQLQALLDDARAGSSTSTSTRFKR